MLHTTTISPFKSMAYFEMGYGHKCLILGHQERLSDNPLQAIVAAIELGASPERVCIVHAPNSSEQTGFQQIKIPDYQTPVEAEGVILTEQGSAAIIQTADCPTIILTDGATGRKVVTHAGRPALTPQGHCTDCTIVENALAQLGAKDRNKVHAFVVGDICGTCFLHDHESALPLVAPFLRLGEQVFDDVERHGLSLFKVIKLRLTHAGVPTSNITHYGNCTFHHDHYASHRREGNRDDRNHVIVVKVR
jgi:copper oxidase (laccase) domain-containing protein